MTAVNEFMHDAIPARQPAIAVPNVDGGRLMVRGGQSLLGAALMLAAVGLWIMPGSNVSSDVMLMKLALSVTAAGIGISLTHQSKTSKEPEIEIDTVRREVRIVQRSRKGVENLKRMKFSDLDRADVDGNHFTLWGLGDAIIAEVDIEDPRMHRSLKSALLDAGKV